MDTKRILKCVNTIISIAMLIILALLIVAFFRMKETGKIIDKIEYTDSTLIYNQIYYEKTIKELKKENKELYDSLVSKNKNIDYLLSFKAKKKYKIDTVFIQAPDTTKVNKTYEYKSQPNDTLTYELKINSSSMPNWYHLKMTTSEKFMIVNKEYDNGMNQVTIGGNNGNGGTEISDVTVFNQKKKKKLKDRFIIGPSVTAGYDVVNNKVGITAGVGVTIDLW